MKNFAVAALLLLACATAASADDITLTATVRDFHDSHSDFEATIGGLNLGMVSPILGADHRPVYVGVAGYGSVASAASFNQWWNDTPGVNTSASLPLTLTGSGGVFGYHDDSFFPIDGALFGNEGYGHNYHFTVELHSSFTYQAGQTFSFIGDDDVWVFINNQLVVDLGGIHPSEGGSVDLSTLGLTLGNDYAFDFFFAERHTTDSHFHLETANIVLRPVPEPATMILLGVGAAGLALRRRLARK